MSKRPSPGRSAFMHRRWEAMKEAGGPPPEWGKHINGISINKRLELAAFQRDRCAKHWTPEKRAEQSERMRLWWAKRKNMA